MNHLIPENFQALTSGLAIDPLFLFADGLRANEIGPTAAWSEAKRHRLVKAPKSPTGPEALEIAHKKHKFEFNALCRQHCEVPPEAAVVAEREPGRVCTSHGTPGTQTIIEFREWADEWRIRTAVECTSGQLPPDNAGTRESVLLSDRGAKKIAESCEFMHLQKGGFKTFVTGTFTQEKRDQIAAGETTIQKEVSRAMDALQKMYQRGWTTSAGEKVPGHSEGLPYLWVVEIPKNEEGEDNPHVHMLLGWRVEYQHFRDWAKRIEGIWGNGYFHLEKIQDSACAGAYMAKAAGYLTKAQGVDDQGRVKGNRYGISETARAPDWVTLSRSQIHTMGQLIYDIYDHLTVKHGDKYRERARLNKALADTPKTQKAKRLKIGKRLAMVRQKIKEIPVRCNGYQVILRGTQNAWRFFGWAKAPAGETNEWSQPDWLPEKPEGWEWKQGKQVTPADSQFMTRLRDRFRFNRMWRRLNVPDWFREVGESLEYWHAVKGEYELEALVVGEDG